MNIPPNTYMYMFTGNELAIFFVSFQLAQLFECMKTSTVVITMESVNGSVRDFVLAMNGLQPADCVISKKPTSWKANIYSSKVCTKVCGWVSSRPLPTPQPHGWNLDQITW